MTTVRVRREKARAAHANGYQAEKLVEQKLRSLGFTVRMMGSPCAFDLMCQDKRVEVKWAAPSDTWRWQVNIHRHGILNENWVDVYVIVLADVPGCNSMPIYLVIPAPIGRLSLRFSFSTLVRRYHSYIDNWRVLEDPRRPSANLAPLEDSPLSADTDEDDASIDDIEDNEAQQNIE